VGGGRGGGVGAGEVMGGRAAWPGFPAY